MTVSAAALSLTLAVSSLAPTPAVAGDNEDLARFALGIGLLAAVAAAASQNRDDDRKKPTVPARRWDRDQPVIRQPHGSRPVHWDQKPTTRRVLPQECVRSFDLDRGVRRFLMRECLEDRGIRTSRLPDSCERVIDMPGRKPDRLGWSRRCLMREGYAVR